DVVLSVTLPLSENVCGGGVCDGAVGVLLLHAIATMRDTDAHNRFNMLTAPSSTEPRRTRRKTDPSVAPLAKQFAGGRRACASDPALDFRNLARLWMGRQATEGCKGVVTTFARVERTAYPRASWKRCSRTRNRSGMNWSECCQAPALRAASASRSFFGF